jgi:hypothetical protein
VLITVAIDGFPPNPFPMVAFFESSSHSLVHLIPVTFVFKPKSRVFLSSVLDDFP